MLSYSFCLFILILLLLFYRQFGLIYSFSLAMPKASTSRDHHIKELINEYWGTFSSIDDQIYCNVLAVLNCKNVHQHNRYRKKIAGKYIWVNAYETCNIKGRCITNVIIGALHPTCGEQTLLVSTKIKEMVNGKPIAKIVVDSVDNIFGPGSGNYINRVLLLTIQPYTCSNLGGY